MNFLSKMFLVGAMIFVIGTASASLNVQLSDQGTGVTNSDGDLQSGNLTVLIYEAASGGESIYNETFVDAIYNGSWNVMLGSNAPTTNLSLEFGKKYYRDYFILGEDATFDAEDRQAFYSPLGDIGEEDISGTTNLTLGQKITFAFGEIIDNMVDGWIRITGGLNVTENVTAKYFIGDGSQLTGVGATNYYPTSVNLTTGTQTAGVGGYASANAICAGEFSGSHLCTEFEIASWFANQGAGITGDAWIIGGSPKYAPASLPVNDCNGFTHGAAGSYLGNYWHFNITEMGDGRAIHCGSTLKLACCTY
jgi:hypothetical protein